MAAVWLRARVDLRRRLWTVAAAVLVVALVGGLVLAAIAGASRTRSALPRFLEWSRPEQMEGFAEGTLAEQEVLAEQLARLPEVAAAAPAAFVVLAAVDDGRPILGVEGGIGATALIDPAAGRTMTRPLMVEGRLPSPRRANEVAVDEDFASHWDVGIGDHFGVVAYGPEQLEDIGNARRVQPTGPAFDARVTGIVRLPSDLAIDTFNQTGSLFEVNRRSFLLSAAFWVRHRDAIATYGVEYSFRLRDGVEPAQLAGAARELSDNVFVDTVVGEPAVTATQRSVDLQAHALLASGALLAVVAAVMLGQSFVRGITRSADDDRLLLTLGLTKRQLMALAVLRVMPIAIGGALGAVAVAVALSPLTPFGTARRAEIDAGVDVNWAVLGFGAVVIVAFLVSVAVLAIRSTARGRRRTAAASSTTGAWLNRVGAPAPVVVGASLAAGGGRPGAALSGRVAVVAAIVGVGAISAASAFGASLQRFVDTPTLWGQTWDVMVGNYSEPESSAAGSAALRANDRVSEFSAVTSQFVTVDGRTLGGIAIDPVEGDLRPELLEGEYPDRPSEINVGRRTLGALGKKVGDAVEIGNQGATFRARITGVVIVPATISVDTRLGEGVTMTPGTLRRIPGTFDFAGAYIVRFTPGVTTDAGIASLRRDFEAAVVEPVTTFDIESLSRVRALPWILAFLAGALAITTIGHALIVTVRRQRRDLAVLKTLGFSRAQVRRTIAAEASAFSVVALLVGIPLGIFAGRIGWRLAVDAIGIEVSPAIPLVLVLLVPAALLLCNALAAVPAAAAARIQPAVALRRD